MNTPEGTVYVYEKQGTYTAGVSRYQGPSEMSAPSDNEPSNVLKIKTATDRHGNTTTYTYGSGTVSFDKVNGTTSEHPLTAIQMPNGHKIAFDWTGNRMTKAKEIGAGSTVLREVTYGYTSGMLTSVTTPAGKTTTYGYGACSTGYTGAATPPAPGGNYPQTLMTSITDPRGLTTSILYEMDHNYRYGVTPMVRKISWPNSQYTDFFNYSATVSGSGNEAYGFTDYYLDSSTKVYTNTGQISLSIGSNEATVYETRAISGDMSFAQPALREVTYNLDTMDLVKEVNRAYDFVPNSFFQYIFGDPNMPPALVSKTETTAKFNFLGNPLEKTFKEYTFSGTYGSDFTTFTLDRTATTGYSYWGAEKYYQRKALKDPGGRYSFTDYYDTSSTTGKKGQVYKVFDQERVTIAPNLGVTPPEYAIPGTEWRYQVQVADDTKYSVKFDYDSKGRAIDVWKIQSTTSSPWAYARTHTTYGSDTDGSWGAPSSVIEDYGSLNRTTNNLEYDVNGRVIKVENAAGNIFHTSYDDDGLIQSIEQIIAGVSTPIATYTYGASGLTNGQILSITDNLSGVSQDFTYTSSGAGKGMPASVTETNGLNSYVTAYTYNSAGDRDSSTYTTQATLGLSSTVKWRYSDYVPLSLPTSTTRAFQRLTSLNPSTGNPSSEEFHYSYDYQGRLRQATFAQTPQSGFTPSTGGFYYDASHRPATRGRTYTEYDSGGRIKGVYHWWDTWNSGTSSFTSAPIRKNECTYELSTLNRGLKTQSKFYNVSSGSWNLQRTETYGYDAKRDYLTSANYGDGSANATPSWTYDDAGNRASDSTISGSWTYDNLNRMTASPSYTYINTVTGNRLEKTGSSAWAVRHSWDVLNRMTQSYVNGSNDVVSMTYRADGLRVTKANAVPGNNANKFTYYRYDGQMGVEDVEVTSGGTYNSVTRYTLGARGIDAISRTTSGGTSISYPLYDAHGNNIGLVSKSGSSWSISDERSYDAWGQVRSGGGSGDQKGRHSANLGHKQDDESGLIYMRARFCDTSSGRFVSEDPARNGINWFTYCENNPVSQTDFDGKDPELDARQALGWARGLTVLGLAQMVTAAFISKIAQAAAISSIIFLLAWFWGDMNAGMNNLASPTSTGDKIFTGLVLMTLVNVATEGMNPSVKATDTSPVAHVVGLCMQHAGFLGVFIGLEIWSEGY